uniref:Cadherin domain-containing protein n=1 Tax=Knipowitschia caucasica TaxID=637954 RepID=A0AAV2JQP5_KNICA
MKTVEQCTHINILSSLYAVAVVVHGQEVTRLEAVDPEDDPLIYGITGEEAMKFFRVEQDGRVWLGLPLDREIKSEMQVEFTVRDSFELVTGTVNIQIGDVNDNAPTFHGQPYTVQIPELSLLCALRFI